MEKGQLAPNVGCPKSLPCRKKVTGCGERSSEHKEFCDETVWTS